MDKFLKDNSGVDAGGVKGTHTLTVTLPKGKTCDVSASIPSPPRPTCSSAAPASVVPPPLRATPPFGRIPAPLLHCLQRATP